MGMNVGWSRNEGEIMFPKDSKGRPIIGKHRLGDDEYEIIIFNHKLFSNTEYETGDNQIGIPMMASSEAMCCRLKFELIDVLVKKRIQTGDADIDMGNINNITEEFMNLCRENIEKIQSESKNWILERRRRSREKEREYFKKMERGD
jgi:hypothetical protein